MHFMHYSIRIYYNSYISTSICFRFLPSIPVPYKNSLAPWVCPSICYFSSQFFIHLAFLFFFFFFFLMLSISFSLCLSFQCAVSIASKCTFETQQDHGPFPRAINEIILSRNLTFCFSWRFRFTKPFVRCRCILFFYTTISERRYVGKLLTFVKNVKRLENTTARERHTGSIETFFVRTILS